MQQLYQQRIDDQTFERLGALYLERVENYGPAIDSLSAVCASIESVYEEQEDSADLLKFAQARVDLARNQLAARNYEQAAEDAQTALDLSSDFEDAQAHPEALKKLHLSARLTSGLAHYFLQDMDNALANFSTALKDSGDAPDVVCLLAEVLWAKGGDDEKGVAREQLFETVEKHPEHVGVVVLLGAMAALDEDDDAMDAVKDELENLRTSGINEKDMFRVQKVLDSIAAITNPAAEAGEDVGVDVMEEIQTSILLSPAQPHGWEQLAEFSGEGFPAQMALKTATGAVPPLGPLEADDLARVFAGTGMAADAQRAIMMAPWTKQGWKTLSEL